MSSEVTAAMFDKNRWSKQEAENWLMSHNLTPIKNVHETDNYYRYRMKNPKGYHMMRTKKLNDGINLIIGFY
jgi:hypothetical protein